MKIAFIGCGAAGSVFASYLKCGGTDDIWLVDLNKVHLDRIATEGLIFRTPEGEKKLTGFHTTTDASVVGICDAVIIVVKATQTHDAMKSAISCVGPETVLVSLQNGLGNDLKLMKYVPSDRIVYGSGRIGTEMPEPGVCISRPNANLTNMHMGPAKKSPLTDKVGRHLADAFRRGGLNPEYFDDVRPYIWKKAASNSGFNTVCAVLRMKVKEVAEDKNGMQLVMDILKEAADVAKALGIEDLWPTLKADIPSVVKSLGDYYPSMAQDLLIHHRETEVSVLTGAISEYGRQVGVPTPTCDVLTHVVEAMQANYDILYK